MLDLRLQIQKSDHHDALVFILAVPFLNFMETNPWWLRNDDPIPVISQKANR